MVSWLIIMVVSVELSAVLLFVQLCINCFVVFKTQSNRLLLEPVTSAIMSLILPMYRLPSEHLDDEISYLIFSRLSMSGNVFLLLTWFLMGLAKSFNWYNPWSGDNQRTILLRESWFHASFGISTLFLQATNILLLLFYFLAACKVSQSKMSWM